MPWSDKPKAVEVSEETMKRIGSHLRAFSGRRFYPDTPEGFKKLCRAVGKIVYDKPNGSLWDNTDIPVNPKVGPIENDLDWLMEIAYEQLTICPTPAHFRALYCQYFRPADGVMISMKVDEL